MSLLARDVVVGRVYTPTYRNGKEKRVLRLTETDIGTLVHFEQISNGKRRYENMEWFVLNHKRKW